MTETEILETTPSKPIEKKAVIHYYVPITFRSVALLQEQILRAIQERFNSFELHMSSAGGDLVAGFSAYNFLRSLSLPLTTFNFGNIESIATLVYLAGDKRLVVPHGRFLLHNLSWTVPGATVDFLRLAEYSASLDFDAQRFCNIFQERTNGAELPVNVMDCLKGSARILDASAATAAGIAHSVTSPEGTTPSAPVNWWVTGF